MLQFEQLDKTVDLPLVAMLDGHATGAAWVKTTIKYSGFFGYRRAKITSRR